MLLRKEAKMSNIVDCTGNKIVKNLPKVVDAEPFGSMVLVEHLTAQEILGTSLEVGDSTQVGSPQSYVLKLGPKVPEYAGIKAGDRVLLQGTYVPVPDYGESERERGLVEMHNIKAILIEN